MSPPLRRLLPAFGLALLWLLLTDGNPGAWVVGVPAVLLAAWVVRPVGADQRGRLSLIGLLRFLPFFVWESMRGGIDVARRVVGPRLRVMPGLVSYAVRLRGPQARLLFVNSASLLPGTLVADIQDDRLQVHALDRNGDFFGELHRLETAVGRVYGEAV